MWEMIGGTGLRYFEDICNYETSVASQQACEECKSRLKRSGGVLIYEVLYVAALRLQLVKRLLCVSVSS